MFGEIKMTQIGFGGGGPRRPRIPPGAITIIEAMRRLPELQAAEAAARARNRGIGPGPGRRDGGKRATSKLVAAAAAEVNRRTKHLRRAGEAWDRALAHACGRAGGRS